MTSKSRWLAVATAFLIATAAYADWEQIGPGVEYQRFLEPQLDVHVTKIDLTNDDIRVVSTRESERGMKVSEYAKKTRAIAAINGDYFDAEMRPIGLAIGPCGRWEGTKDTGREGVFAIGDGRADIQTQSLVMDPPEPWIETAVSGWPMLVRECVPLTAKELPGSDAFTRQAHPRTAVGLTRDRRTLYLVVADGRREGVPGMTLAQLGAFMSARLNVCSAINMDGGGSSAMWVTDEIVNKPSDGRERRVADHLAVVLERDFTGCDTQEMAQASMFAASVRASAAKKEAAKNDAAAKKDAAKNDAAKNDAKKSDEKKAEDVSKTDVKKVDDKPKADEKKSEPKAEPKSTATPTTATSTQKPRG